MARKTKEESQKTRDGILDAAERVFLEKGVGTTAMADLADAAGVSRGAVYGHYKNKIEVCLAMCDRAFGQIEVPDENARVPALDILLRAGMGFLRQCCEPGSVQRVLEILYLKCERSDENEPLLRNHERVLLMGRREAEFSKYAANAFLATKISFMNEMAGLCALTGVDIEDVRRGMGSDKRIGTHFIYAGCGYGGSCFPKDVRALIRSAEQQGFDSQILRAVEARNARQKELLFETLGELFQGRWQGRTVALWGLAFKPGTDDLREAPSLVLLEALLRHGVRVRAHDPVANAGVAARYPDALACAQLTLHDSPYAAVEGADALVLVTEWKQFRQPDFQKIRGSMRTPLLVDGRNLYAPARMAELGFIYQGIGRPRAGHCKASAA
ncbi:nucleotide sugar dehydrogenase [Pseudomonas aeruginosa]|uniref:nucleotide sugar dehydrogenase n=1 Tax=Pseudomonas aeruginosa TaxID=287 RepID=UPI003F589681